MATIAWDDYIQAAISAENLEQYKRRGASVLEDQRAAMRRLYELYRPKRVACLGAGGLNDIPIDEFLLGGSEVFLVDWIPGISREGFRAGLITGEGETRVCMICDERCDPGRLCAGYREPVRVPGTVCDAFELQDDPYPRCASYAPGEEPHFLTADITLGRASSFARRVMKFVPTSRNVERCLQKGLSEIRHIGATRDEIPIASDSIDFVTSSMVVSQFDYEPYSYFSKLLVDRFGLEHVRGKEEKVIHIVERLRDELFRVQVEGHVQEMHRIVNKKRGKVYFSVELFRSMPGQEDSYFLVHGITRALEVLNEYFHFDFGPIPPEQSLMKLPIGDGISIVQGLVMSPTAD